METDNQILKSAVSRIIETDISTSDSKSLKAKIIHLIEHISAPERVATTVAKHGISKLIAIA